MLTNDITRKAKLLYPDNPDFAAIYAKGFLAGLNSHLGTDEDFYTKLATELRGLWPTGEKDGKWPWKDSVANIAERLKTLWALRELKDYSIDTCLSIAMRYTSQYENNKKYMKVLKYFILKQKDIIEKDGKIKHVSESKFADMLEGKSEVDAALNEWESILTGTIDDGGVLI